MADKQLSNYGRAVYCPGLKSATALQRVSLSLMRILLSLLTFKKTGASFR